MKGEPLRRQAFRYFLSTGLSAALTLGLPALLHEVFDVDEELAVGVSLIVAFFVNFAVARYYIFESRGPAGHQLIRFGLVSAAFRALEYGAFLILHTWLGLMYLLALGVVLVISFVAKFFVNRQLVFASVE